MNRQHTIADYLAKIRHMRAINPGIEISTDLIVGFPSETDAEFEETLRVMETVRFGQVFSFKYSPRPGTQAEAMNDDVPRPVKEERLARLIALQDRINDEEMARFVGSEQEILIEGAHPRKPGVWHGRTPGYRPVSVTRPDIAVGDIFTVRITAAKSHWLFSEEFPPCGSGPGEGGTEAAPASHAT